MKKAAFFDIDNTIYNGFFYKDLGLVFWKKGLIPFSILLRLPYLFLLEKMSLLSDEKMYKYLSLVLENKKVRMLNKLTRNAFHTNLKNKIYPEIAPLMSELKKEGFQITLVSSQFEETVEIFAKYLQVDNYLCSQLEKKNGRFTGQIKGKYCHGAEKARVTVDYSKRKGIDISRSRAYADNISDYEFLKCVGFPVVVNPSKRLKKMAVSNNWEILDLKKE